MTAAWRATDRPRLASCTSSWPSSQQSASTSARGWACAKLSLRHGQTATRPRRMSHRASDCAPTTASS
eukprot:6217676-Pyramimonas_sp.AAC.1